MLYLFCLLGVLDCFAVRWMINFPIANKDRQDRLPIHAEARISHGLSTATADPGMPTALGSVGIDALSSTPPESARRAPCIHTRLRRLATKSRERCGRAQ